MAEIHESGMSTKTKVRRTFVLFLTTAIIGCHLVCIFTRKDRWPFSDYHMYAAQMKDTKILHSFGILKDDPTMEVQIPYEGVHEPRSVRVLLGLAKVMRGKKEELTQEELDEVARQVGTLYERQRAKGQGKFPPISGLRIYEQTWLLNETARESLPWKKGERRIVGESTSF